MIFVNLFKSTFLGKHGVCASVENKCQMIRRVSELRFQIHHYQRETQCKRLIVHNTNFQPCLVIAQA